MKKYLIPIMILIVITSFTIIFSKNKNNETYQLKANNSIEIGSNIPPGRYLLKTEEKSISVNINRKDGSSVLSEVMLSNNGENSIEGEINIPKDTIITTNKDAILIKK